MRARGVRSACCLLLLVVLAATHRVHGDAEFPAAWARRIEKDVLHFSDKTILSSWLNDAQRWTGYGYRVIIANGTLWARSFGTGVEAPASGSAPDKLHPVLRLFGAAACGYDGPSVEVVIKVDARNSALDHAPLPLFAWSKKAGAHDMLYPHWSLLEAKAEPGQQWAQREDCTVCVAPTAREPWQKPTSRSQLLKKPSVLPDDCGPADAARMAACRFVLMVDPGASDYGNESLAYLLSTGATVLVPESDHLEFYSDGMAAYAHTVPLSLLLSDAGKKLAWSRAFSSKASRIAADGTAYAQLLFKRELLVEYVRRLLKSYSRLLNFDPGATTPAEPFVKLPKLCGAI